MPIELRWNAAVRATTWHVAQRALDQARFANPLLLAGLQPVVGRLADLFATADHEPAALFARLLPLALRDASTQRVFSNELKFDAKQVSQFEATFGDLEQVLRQLVPRIEQELALRSGPIQTQWEARGPGLVRSIERLTGAATANWNAVPLDIALVYPVCGGYARSYPAAQVAIWEAVLTDVEPRLPELLRLGWLVAQQIFWTHLVGQTEMTRPEFETLGLAAAAVTLTAGEELELARDDRATFELALKTWRPPQTDVSTTAALVSDWWSAARGQRDADVSPLSDLIRRLTPS